MRSDCENGTAGKGVNKHHEIVTGEGPMPGLVQAPVPRRIHERIYQLSVDCKADDDELAECPRPKLSSNVFSYKSHFGPERGGVDESDEDFPSRHGDGCNVSIMEPGLQEKFRVV